MLVCLNMFQWLLGWLYWWPQFFAPFPNPCLLPWILQLFNVSGISFPIPDTKFNHVTCFWPMDTSECIVISRRGSKSLLSIPLMLLCLAITMRTCLDQASGRWRTNGTKLSHPSYPSKDYPKSAFSQQIPIHVTRPRQDQKSHLAD